MPGARVPTKDHGIEGWYRALEILGDDADRLRVGDRFLCDAGRMRIVGLSKRPAVRGGVVVRVTVV